MQYPEHAHHSIRSHISEHQLRQRPQPRPIRLEPILAHQAEVLTDFESQKPLLAPRCVLAYDLACLAPKNFSRALLQFNLEVGFRLRFLDQRENFDFVVFGELNLEIVAFECKLAGELD